MNPPTLLLADDEPHMLRLIAFALKPVQARVLTATSGLDALRILREEPVSLVLLDVHMADLDGLVALREIRANPALRDLPVILLTAAGETHIEEQGRALGAQAFFRKPFSPSQLAAKVRELLPPVAPPPAPAA